MAYMYTSGTTGVSKGVLISHAHAYTYASREHQERPRDGDRILVTLPVFHLAGQWYGVYQALIHGLPSFVAPGFSVSRYWDTVRTQGSTVTVMLGAMAELLQQQPPRPDDADNPLDLAVMAPLASDVTGFCRRFGLRAAAVYGMSEIGAVLDGPPETVVGGEAGFPSRPRPRSTPSRRPPPAWAPACNPVRGGGSTPSTASQTYSTSWSDPTPCSRPATSTKPRPHGGGGNGRPSPSCPGQNNPQARIRPAPRRHAKDRT